MAQGRITPWSGWQEWDTVRKGLLSGDAGSETQSLQQIQVWRARGRIPLAAESTACLLELKHSDQPCSRMNESILKLQYALCLIRLVNGVTDSAQKGKVASSVSSLASMAEMPRVLVDVRHEASHNDMPSLPVLRLAASQAWHWLCQHYWQAQVQQLQQQDDQLQSTLQAMFAAKLKPMADHTAEQDSHSSRELLASLKAFVLPHMAAQIMDGLTATGILTQATGHSTQVQSLLDDLSAVYSNLPALLLSHMVASLLSAAATAKTTLPPLEPAKPLKAKTAPRKKAKAATAAAQPHAAASKPDAHQASMLIRACLDAYMKLPEREVAAHTFSGPPAGQHQSAGSALISSVLGVLLQAVQLAAGGSSQLSAAVPALLQLSVPQTAAPLARLPQQPQDQKSSGSGAAGLEKTASSIRQEQRELLSKHGQTTASDPQQDQAQTALQPTGNGPGSLPTGSADVSHAAAPEDQQPAPRWTLAPSWRPCSLGCLPSELNPQGDPPGFHTVPQSTRVSQVSQAADLKEVDTAEDIMEPATAVETAPEQDQVDMAQAQAAPQMWTDPGGLEALDAAGLRAGIAAQLQHISALCRS